MAYGSTALSSNASFDPFWWRAAPHGQKMPSILPKWTDVAIVGSGITGLSRPSIWRVAGGR